MRTYIAPVHQAYLPPQAMDYEGSGPACCVLTSRPPVLLLAVLTAAVLILSSAYAEVAAFTSRAESRTIGSVDVTTGGQPTVHVGVECHGAPARRPHICPGNRGPYSERAGPSD